MRLWCHCTRLRCSCTWRQPVDAILEGELNPSPGVLHTTRHTKDCTQTLLGLVLKPLLFWLYQLTESSNKFSNCLVVCFVFVSKISKDKSMLLCVWIHLNLRMGQTVSSSKLFTGSYLWVFVHDSSSLELLFSPFCLPKSLFIFTTALRNFPWLSNLCTLIHLHPF